MATRTGEGRFGRSLFTPKRLLAGAVVAALTTGAGIIGYKDYYNNDLTVSANAALAELASKDNSNNGVLDIYDQDPPFEVAARRRITSASLPRVSDAIARASIAEYGYSIRGLAPVYREQKRLVEEIAGSDPTQQVGVACLSALLNGAENYSPSNYKRDGIARPVLLFESSPSQDTASRAVDNCVRAVAVGAMDAVA